MKFERKKLECPECKKPLRYDNSKKALVCKADACAKKDQVGGS